MVNWKFKLVMLLGLAVAAPPEPPPADAETQIASQTAYNIFVYMQVDPDAAQDLLPEAWTSVPWTTGAWAGANLMLLFDEAFAEFGADGKAVRDAGFLSARVVTWGRSDTVKWRIFVTQSFATDDLNPSPGTPRTLAALRREMTRLSAGSDHPKVTERWTVAADGGEMALEMSFDARKARFSKSSGRVADPGDPEGGQVVFHNEQLSYMIQG